MEAIILAAGVGSRLGALAAGRPKCLVPVAGVSILGRQVAALREVGVERLVVVTGYRAADVERALGGIDATFVHNPRFRDTNVLYSWALGSAHLRGDHFYLHGDTVFELDVLKMALAGPQHPVVLTVDRHACGPEEMKVRVVGEDVTQVTKEMPSEGAFGEFSGVMLVRGSILSELRQIGLELLATSGGDRLFFEAALQELTKRRSKQVAWVDVSGLKWREVDFPEDWAAAEDLFR